MKCTIPAQTVELLQESGREFASQLLGDAINRAESDNERRNSIYMLSVAAARIIALQVATVEHAGGEKLEDVFENFFSLVRSEFVQVHDEFAMQSGNKVVGIFGQPPSRTQH